MTRKLPSKQQASSVKSTFCSKKVVFHGNWKDHEISHRKNNTKILSAEELQIYSETLWLLNLPTRSKNKDDEINNNKNSVKVVRKWKFFYGCSYNFVYCCNVEPWVFRAILLLNSNFCCCCPYLISSFFFHSLRILLSFVGEFNFLEKYPREKKT